jgi:signal transduction histidine kinase
MAETIRAAIARSEDVIDRLLQLAESEELVVREPVDVGALATEVVGHHAHASEARGIAFTLSLKPALVEGDRALLGRLVDNLIDNAVRYATAASVVEVSVAATAQAVTLRVANAGEVIDTDELPHLFDRFYRRGTSRSRRTGGSGLGLAIVAAVAEVHGGDVTAEAPPGGGLIVTVTLPHSSTPARTRGAVST